MTQYTLLTGATGLVGAYLVKDLLQDDAKLAVLVRPGRKQSARERVEVMMQHWERELGKSLPRPVCLEGSISEAGLGLHPEQREWVKTHCDRMIHNAAILQFNGKDRGGEPWQTNYYGTEKVIKFCEEVGIRDMHYVSTAYVCGQQPGPILETQLDEGQTFRNDYEESKFEAEKLIRAAECFDTLTVYRPTIIAGDSTTGYTSTYHGLYLYMKIISFLVKSKEEEREVLMENPPQVQMDGDEPLNIVPVDWTAAAIARLIQMPEAHGNTFHVAPDVRMTPNDLVESGQRFYDICEVDFGGKNDPAAEKNEYTQLVAESTTVYQSYETTDPVYDTTNLKKFLPDMPCPPIDEEVLQRFWAFGEADRWGKRKGPKLAVDFWAEDYLENLNLSAADSSGKVGIDISGPGGGQWTLDRSQGQIVDGVSADADLVLQLTIEEFVNLLQPQSTPTAQTLAGFLTDETEASEQLLSEVAETIFDFQSAEAGTPAE